MGNDKIYSFIFSAIIYFYYIKYYLGVCMFKLISSLFRSKNGKESTDNSVDEPIEKRKCKQCLRKYDADKSRCPYCGCSEFYDY